MQVLIGVSEICLWELNNNKNKEIDGPCFFFIKIHENWRVKYFFKFIITI